MIEDLWTGFRPGGMSDSGAPPSSPSWLSAEKMHKSFNFSENIKQISFCKYI